MLYRLTREDFEKLSKREGGYTVQEMDVSGGIYEVLNNAGKMDQSK